MRTIGRVTWAAMLLVGSVAAAENAKDLPKATSYVSDFAGVLDASTKQQIERLCGEVDHQAHSQIAVVTVHNLGDTSIEDFTADLEHRWGVGKKGSDRGVLMLFAMDEHKDRIEVGYGLEGLLNDAKVGDILLAQRPLMKQGQYSQAIYGDVQQVANDIAADANVTLTQPQHTYHRERAQQSGVRPGTILRILVIVLVLFLIFRRRGGSGGGYRGGGGGGIWPWLWIGSMMGGRRDGWSNGGSGSGGGWSGGGNSGGDDGGGFGGFGGGDSGGGGASGDW